MPYTDPAFACSPRRDGPDSESRGIAGHGAGSHRGGNGSGTVAGDDGRDAAVERAGIAETGVWKESRKNDRGISGLYNGGLLC